MTDKRFPGSGSVVSSGNRITLFAPVITTIFFKVKGRNKKNRYHYVTMKLSIRYTGLISLAFILVAVLLVSGCTQQAATPSPAQTVTTQSSTAAATTPITEGKKMFTFTQVENGKSGDITQNTRFAVVLAENPTTGFLWNATLSSGLELQSSDYRQDDAPSGMVGVGGNRTWVIVAKDLGDQKFSALYRRSWENITGNETMYTVNVKVVKA